MAQAHDPNPGAFVIKDSGTRTEFSSGMVRDKAEDKTEYWSMRIGPMYRRWAELLTKGRKKYPDTASGVPNWTLAAGEAERLHAKESFTRHIEAYLDGQEDEDHAAAIIFNLNLMEYIKEKLAFEAETGASAEVISDVTIQRHIRAGRCRTSPRVGWQSELPRLVAPAGALKPGAVPGTIIVYTPTKTGCPALGCHVPGLHAGPHLIL